MSWDTKVTLYIFLGYLFYGFSNCITLGSFVPPLPAVPFILLFIGLMFSIKTPFSIYTFFYLMITISFSIHLFTFLPPFLIEIFSFIGLLSMILIGIYTMITNFNNTSFIGYSWSVLMLSSPILLLDVFMIKFLYYLILGFFTVLYLRNSSLKNDLLTRHKRLLLTIGLICAIFSLNILILNY